jgi:hypothetical protein
MDRMLILLKASSFSTHTPLEAPVKLRGLESSTVSLVHCIQLLPYRKIFCLSRFLSLETTSRSQRAITDQQRNWLTCKILNLRGYLCTWAKWLCTLSWWIYHLPDSYFLSPSRCTASHKYQLISFRPPYKI